jgi:hypothetical protein
VHIVDKTLQRRFLVDTGAAYSIFPSFSPGKQSGIGLFGFRRMPFGLRKRATPSSG